jgi:hypothetical protein
MSIQLPPAIDRYVRIENSGDVDALPECFAADSVVRDESHTYRGLAAIKDWKIETKRKYSHTMTSLRVERRDGTTVLTAEVAGQFPGSPVTLAFHFTLEGEKIAALEITNG